MACLKKIAEHKYRVDWRDKEGNRYRKTFATRKEAGDFLAGVTVDLKAGTYVGPKVVPTLREAAELWFANKVGMKLRPSTLCGYRTNLDRHILAAGLAEVRLDRIGVGDITAFRNSLSEKPGHKGATLSAKSVNYILRDLEAIFAYAVKARLAAWNPVSNVDRLRQGSEEHGEDGGSRSDVAVNQDEVLSPSDCRRLVDAAAPGFGRALLMTAVMTGARHDELLALRWSDVDLDKGTLHFRRSLSWAKLPGEPTRPKFFDVKTGSKGNRKVPIPAELRLELKKWRLQCPKGELDLVFPTPDGQPQHRTRILQHVLRPALRCAGIHGRFHMHSLRHSFCSALLAQGTPPTEVQKYSGHARLSTLLDTYSHFIPSERTGSIERLAQKVLG